MITKIAHGNKQYTVYRDGQQIGFIRYASGWWNVWTNRTRNVLGESTAVQRSTLRDAVALCEEHAT